jgi:hypothetical protein
VQEVNEAFDPLPAQIFDPQIPKKDHSFLVWTEAGNEIQEEVFVFHSQRLRAQNSLKDGKINSVEKLTIDFVEMRSSELDFFFSRSSND